MSSPPSERSVTPDPSTIHQLYALLTAEQDAQIRRLAEHSPRSNLLREQRYKVVQKGHFEQ